MRSRKCSVIDFTKIRNKISHFNQTEPSIVFVLSGALSPVHNMHIGCFEICKKYFEDRNRVVVGSFLCPSSDSYVKSKLNRDAINLHNRIIFSHVAVKSSDWIDVITDGMANAGYIVSHVEEQLKREIPEHNFEVWLVVGSDHALRHELYYSSYQKVICVYRPGEGDELNKILKTIESKKQSNNNFCTVQFQGEDLSSTKVRLLIRSGRWDELSTLLPVEVFELLKAWGEEKTFEF